MRIISLQAMLLLLLSLFGKASSDNTNNDCLLRDELFQEVCKRCNKGFILDQMQTSCVQINQSEAETEFQNCLQISSFRECIRCDCGYVLEEQFNICVRAPSSLIGCETSSGENICTRPKEDYVLVRENISSQLQVLFAYGSHCEIFDFQNGSCSQCHAGYRLDSGQSCKRIPERIINEFYSYYSSDGELQSRSITFIAFSKGVYPKINDCEVYFQNQQASNTNIYQLLCQKCSLGKSLNASRTACLKQPFEVCKIVSDSDHSLCEECIDNDNFYLSNSNEYPQTQLCLPRRQLDPTTRCLDYLQHSSKCKQCSNGLNLTATGCGLQKSSLQEQDLREYTDQSYLNIKNSDPNCSFWINLEVCGGCISGKSLNTKGYCVQNSIHGCLVPDHKGGCYQCESLFYYNELSLQCTEIALSTMCRKSSGIADKCDICIDLKRLSFQDEICNSQNVQNCSLNDEESGTICRVCLNMFYLTSSNECVKLTNNDNCILNDGIHDRCLKCRRHFVLSDSSECILLATSTEDGICVDLFVYYFDKTTSSCQKRTSIQLNFCQKYDPNQNRCLQCQEGFKIESNICIFIEFCELSDGIHDWCYLASSETFYINEYGKINFTDKHCLTNKLENTCVACILESLDTQTKEYGALLMTEKMNNGFSYQCMSKNLIGDPNLIRVCYQFKKNEQTGKYQCRLCVNLFYLDENMICQPMLQKGCLVSDGRFNKCIFCQYTYSLDQETKICKLNALEFIPFCEKYNDNICVQCRNLFYMFGSFCRPISDPDCEESDGVSDICQKCVHQTSIDDYISKKSLGEVLCAQIQQIFEYAKEMERDKRHNTETSYQPIVYSEPHLWNSKKLHCNRFHLYSLNCLECESGYYLDSISLLGVICFKINIPYCKDQQGSLCKECEDRYPLINGKCIFLEECESIEKNACSKCSDQSVLWNGRCILIENCKEQFQGTCLRCRTGYFVYYEQQYSVDGDDGMAENNDENNYFQWNSQKKYNKPSSDIQPSNNSNTFSIDSCVRLPHCTESDGISYGCLRCDNGFKLIKGICTRNTLNINDPLQAGVTPHCEDFSNNLICLKCQNLFYLQDNQCVGIQEGNTFCQQSNGITQSCNLCSFRGYELTVEETCRYIENCVISNGLNWCVLCNESYVINLQGRCENIIKQIENCQVYFSFESQSTTPAQALGCLSCSSLHYVDTTAFSQCIRFPDPEQAHCFFSEGKLPTCSICESGYFLKETKWPLHVSCAPSKKFIRAFNFGCQIMNTQTNTCLKCYDRFFLGPTNFCYHRSISQKCQDFHRTKDECLVCKSGYILKTITENYIEKKICLELDFTEKVSNCAEYYPNTNQCKKCIKRLKQDVVEFVLNPKNNACEDVLHLMCRTIKVVQDKKVCLQGYFQNCQIYQQEENTKENISECRECQDGYYLHLDLETKNSSCKKHLTIRNCLVYSKQLPDTCERCEELFFLKKEPTNQLNVCIPISKLDRCREFEAHSDRCSLCNSGQIQRIKEKSYFTFCNIWLFILDCCRFAINQTNGECVESAISHCKILKQSRNQTYHECYECKDNFDVQENGRECMLRFKGQNNNCKIRDSQGICVQCKEGFMVVNEGDYCMPREKSMLCLIEHCSSYDSRSSPDQTICQSCQEGYYLDSVKRCRLQVDMNANENTNHQLNQEGEEEDQQSQSLDGSGNLFILKLVIEIIIVLLLLLIVLVMIRLRKKFKRMKALRIFGKENKRKDIAEKNEEIKTGQSIEIELNNQTIGSLSQISSYQQEN